MDWDAKLVDLDGNDVSNYLLELIGNYFKHFFYAEEGQIYLTAP